MFRAGHRSALHPDFEHPRRARLPLKQKTPGTDKAALKPRFCFHSSKATSRRLVPHSRGVLTPTRAPRRSSSQIVRWDQRQCSKSSTSKLRPCWPTSQPLHLFRGLVLMQVVLCHNLPKANVRSHPQHRAWTWGPSAGGALRTARGFTTRSGAYGEPWAPENQEAVLIMRTPI